MFFKYLCICLFIISGFLYGKTKGQNNNLMSPCPEIFQYRYNGDWYGFIQIPSPRLGQTIKLTLFMTLRAQLVNVGFSVFYNLHIMEFPFALIYVKYFHFLFMRSNSLRLYFNLYIRQQVLFI